MSILSPEEREALMDINGQAITHLETVIRGCESGLRDLRKQLKLLKLLQAMYDGNAPRLTDLLALRVRDIANGFPLAGRVLPFPWFVRIGRNGPVHDNAPDATRA